MELDSRILVAGELRQAADSAEIRNPYNGKLAGIVGQASPSDAEKAIAAADSAFAETRSLPGWKRFKILEAVSRELTERTEELARGISLEAGKPIRDAKAEAARAAQTFLVAAEESKRFGGEILPLDWTPGAENRSALIRRFPIGPLLGITPFNFPLNLVAHKVAPAVASGNPIIIKPAPQTPFTALRLGEMLAKSGWPPAAISVLPCHNEVAGQLLQDPRIKQMSFTGSAAVGWNLKAKVPGKPVTLELGGNAAVVVHSDADIDRAAARIVAGGFAYSGQSCISVQRVFAHSSIAEALLARIVEGARALRLGDPIQEQTQIGPLINEAAAIRAENWIEQAVLAGARLLVGGKRTGSVVEPTVLAGVPRSTPLSCEEAFAPVVYVNSYDDFEHALAMVNDSPYGLQAGIFTADWPRIASAFRTLEVGAVLIDEVPTWRADHMPYGGVKNSGTGREGIRSAIEAMTEPRLLVLSL